MLATKITLRELRTWEIYFKIQLIYSTLAKVGPNIFKIKFFFFLWLNSPFGPLAASHIGGFLNYLDIW
jgi:hypothetical protein